MTKLTIYSKPDCPWCVRAKELAAKHSLPYREIDVSMDPRARDWLVNQDLKTVPQVFDYTHRIGGFEDL